MEKLTLPYAILFPLKVYACQWQKFATYYLEEKSSEYEIPDKAQAVIYFLM